MFLKLFIAIIDGFGIIDSKVAYESLSGSQLSPVSILAATFHGFHLILLTSRISIVKSVN